MSIDKRFISFVVIFYLICLVQIFAGLREDWPFSYFGMFKGRADEQHALRIDLNLVDKKTGFQRSIFELGFDAYNVRRNLRSILLAEELNSSNVQVRHPDYSCLKSDLSENTMKNLRQYFDSEIVSILKKRESELNDKDRFLVVLKLKYWDQFNEKTKDDPVVDKDIYVYQL